MFQWLYRLFAFWRKPKINEQIADYEEYKTFHTQKFDNAFNDAIDNSNSIRLLELLQTTNLHDLQTDYVVELEKLLFRAKQFKTLIFMCDDGLDILQCNRRNSGLTI
jgi:hypothetical protein